MHRWDGPFTYVMYVIYSWKIVISWPIHIVIIIKLIFKLYKKEKKRKRRLFESVRCDFRARVPVGWVWRPSWARCGCAYFVPSVGRVVLGRDGRATRQRGGQPRPGRYWRRSGRRRRQLGFGTPRRAGLVPLVVRQQRPFLDGLQRVVDHLVLLLRVEVHELVGGLVLLLFQFVDAFSDAQCRRRSKRFDGN